MSSPEKDDVFMKLAEDDGKILEELEMFMKIMRKHLKLWKEDFHFFVNMLHKALIPL